MTIREAWAKVKAWFTEFHDSETIIWARVNVAVGAVWTALLQVDLAPLLSAKALTYWLVFSGVVTEYLRRRREESM